MLAMIGIVDCIFRRGAFALPFSIFGHGEWPFRFRLNRTEQNGSVTFFLLLLYMYRLINIQSTYTHRPKHPTKVQDQQEGKDGNLHL